MVSGFADVPVSDNALKKDDLPTLGRPGPPHRLTKGDSMSKNERTDDADFQVVARTSEEDLFLRLRLLLWRHSLFYV